MKVLGIYLIVIGSIGIAVKLIRRLK